MAGTKLRVVRSNFRGFPQFCASCLSTNDLDYRTIKARGFETSIPICSACKRPWLHSVGIAILFVAVMWLNYKLTHIHLPRPIALLLVLLPFVHSYVADALQGPVRVRAKRGDILEFTFSNHEYARLFEVHNPCITNNSELARVL